MSRLAEQADLLSQADLRKIVIYYLDADAQPAGANVRQTFTPAGHPPQITHCTFLRSDLVVTPWNLSLAAWNTEPETAVWCARS